MNCHLNVPVFFHITECGKCKFELPVCSLFTVKPKEMKSVLELSICISCDYAEFYLVYGRKNMPCVAWDF